MTLRLYKLEVVAVCQHLDDDGDVIGEERFTDNGRPIEVFPKRFPTIAEDIKARLPMPRETEPVE